MNDLGNTTKLNTIPCSSLYGFRHIALIEQGVRFTGYCPRSLADRLGSGEDLKSHLRPAREKGKGTGLQQFLLPARRVISSWLSLGCLAPIKATSGRVAARPDFQ